MITTSTGGKVEPWQLEELSEIRPNLIVRDANDTLGRLIIRLSLAFNDLKGIIMLDRYRLQFAPPNGLTAHTGQLGGLLLQVHRYAAGILNEALNAIDEERIATASAEFVALVNSLPTPTQEMWRDLIAEAKSSPANTNRTGRALLNRLRNKSAFHYNGERLLAGFERHFGPPETDFNKAAYYSAGADMDGTRFYFADAAAEQDYKTAGIERGLTTDDELRAFIGKVNDAFALLIIAFLGSRAATATNE